MMKVVITFTQRHERCDNVIPKHKSDLKEETSSLLTEDYFL